ncbi:MAG: DUF4397 domain-containing protein [Acidimicrobiia bacterium]|nr:DUF4397 domain-containing protein [Acidimicrobiia bacterium]
MRRLAVLLALALVASVAGVLAPNAPSAQAASPSAVTVVHGIKGVAVDVYVNGALTVPNFQPRDIAGPLQLDAGDYDIRVLAAGADPATASPLLARTVTVPSGADVSLVAHADTAGGPALTAFVNDLSAAAAGQARVSVRHTANAPAVDVLLDGSPAITGLTNGSAADATLAGGTYSVAVQVSPSGPVAIGPADLTFPPGVLTAVYAISALDGSGIEPLVQQRPMALPPVVPTGSVSVVHGILGVPVDVYVDGVLTLPGFDPKDVAGPLRARRGRLPDPGLRGG